MVIMPHGVVVAAAVIVPCGCCGCSLHHVRCRGCCATCGGMVAVFAPHRCCGHRCFTAWVLPSPSLHCVGSRCHSCVCACVSQSFTWLAFMTDGPPSTYARSYGPCWCPQRTCTC